MFREAGQTMHYRKSFRIAGGQIDSSSKGGTKRRNIRAPVWQVATLNVVRQQKTVVHELRLQSVPLERVNGDTQSAKNI